MKLINTMKKPLALILGAALLVGCNDDNNDDNKKVEAPVEVKVATYNLSFSDGATFEQMVEELEVSPAEQTELVTAYLDGTVSAEDEAMAAKVIQIRNVAAIIQTNRPNVLLMAEFDSNGTGDDKRALVAFQENYLSVAQSTEGAGGEANLEPISFPYFESYASNTGLASGYDLNNDGKIVTDVNDVPDTPWDYANDAWGYGVFHGQYAFALVSQYEIDTENTRSFQEFKWKDLNNAEIPTITICDSEWNKIPEGMECGDEWYTEAEWNEVRLSSKTHIDAPIIIPTADGDQVVHLLLSHPTPPAFDTGKNVAQNAAEVEFWHYYINDADFIYDDAGITGGLEAGAKFVIMGDLNLDTQDGDGISSVMQALHDDELVNQDVMNGALYPVSNGATEFAIDEGETHPMPERITSTFGLAVDYAMPSANLNVTEAAVYWPATFEDGRLLVNDIRIGDGEDKDISSDHRMTWFTTEL